MSGGEENKSNSTPTLICWDKNTGTGGRWRPKIPQDSGHGMLNEREVLAPGLSV